jgi:hypothetical protein
MLTWAMMIVYYGFILLVAFNKEFLSQKLGAGVMTIGVPTRFWRDRLHRHHHHHLCASRQQRIRRPDGSHHQGGAEMNEKNE